MYATELDYLKKHKLKAEEVYIICMFMYEYLCCAVCVVGG